MVGDYCNISGIRITLVISILIMKDHYPMFAYHPIREPKMLPWTAGLFFFATRTPQLLFKGTRNSVFATTLRDEMKST